jgi:hypothetical protein
MEDLIEIGQKAAKIQVKETHFPKSFDLPSA